MNTLPDESSSPLSRDIGPKTQRTHSQAGGFSPEQIRTALLRQNTELVFTAHFVPDAVLQ